MTPLRSRLREETRVWHESAERDMAVLDPSLTHQRYKQILCAFYGFYNPLEQIMPPYQSGDGSFDGQDRRKVHLLHRDLIALGETDKAIASISCCPDLPDVGTVPKQLGCMYVIEGSTLGGQVVLKHVSPALGITLERGGAFFNSYGDQVGPRWKSFISLLEQHSGHAEAEEQIVRSACSTFQKLANWFQGRAL